MKDITFCINKECKKRKDCFRAEENCSKNDRTVRSYAMFNCLAIQKKKRSITK